MTEPALVLSAVAMGLAILGALVGVSLLVDAAIVTWCDRSDRSCARPPRSSRSVSASVVDGQRSQLRKRLDQHARFDLRHAAPARSSACAVVR